MIRSVIRRLTGVVLSLLLGTSPLAAQATTPGSAAQQATRLRSAMDPGKLKAMLINVPTGSPLRLRTRDGVETAGKLTQVTNDGVEMQALVNGNIENRSVPYGDIAGLKTGVRKTGLARLAPIMTLVSLVGTAGALTAAIKK